MRVIRPRVLFMAVGFMSLRLAEARAELPPATAPRSFVDVLRQTAAVIEGDVEDVSFRYDNQEGPRTVATLANIVVHLGSLGSSTPQTLELRSFGGPLPDGREVVAQHVPTFTVGQRHVVFLRNTEWTLSPVAYGFALHVERRGSSEALVDPFGRLVVGVGMSGLLAGAAFWDRRDGALDPFAAKRLIPVAAENAVEKALDPREFAEHLRAFASAMDAWPRGTFSMVPVTHHEGWSFVSTTPAEATDASGMTSDDSTHHDDELLACFGPDEQVADTTVSGGETCGGGGVR